MKKRTPEGEVLTGLILEAFRLNGSMLAAGNRLTKPYGVTSARWQVMGALALAGQSLTVAQIARRMGLTRQAVQRVINDLQGLQMVLLSDNPDHKRASLVALSQKGNETYTAIDKAQIAWVNDLAKELGKQQIVGALDVLQHVSKRLDEANQVEAD